MFLKAGGDRPLLITVLDRIIQKDAYDLREEPRLDLRTDAALYFHRERLSRVLDHLAEAARAALHRLRKIRIDKRQILGRRLPDLGEQHKVIDEEREALHLRNDIARPLVLAVDQLHRLRIRGNDRDRRLQLMAGIRNESLLVLHISDEGADRDPRKHRHDTDEKQKAEQPEERRIFQEGLHRRQIPRAVQNDDQQIAIRGTAHMVCIGPLLLLEIAFALPGLHRSHRCLYRTFRRKGSDVIDIRHLGRTITVQQYGKITGLVREFRRILDPAAVWEPAVPAYAPRGDDAAIVCDGLKHIMNVPPHNEVHHPIDDRERDRYDDEHRQRGQKYELSVQFLDHIHK